MKIKESEKNEQNNIPANDVRISSKHDPIKKGGELKLQKQKQKPVKIS